MRVSLARLKYGVKVSLLWRISAICVYTVNELLWRGTYGLNPTILFVRYLISNRIKTVSTERLKVFGGLKIIHDDVELSNFAQWLHTEIPQDLIAAELSTMDVTEGVNGYTKSIEMKLSKSARLELLRFALSDRNIITVSSYLKFIPRLASIKLMLNKATSNPPLGAQQWHRDWFVHKGMNIFIAVTDVDESSGMYSAID